MALKPIKKPVKPAPKPVKKQPVKPGMLNNATFN
jgi:hypothetical protein